MKKILIAALLLTSCDDLFDTHPYDINFEGETGINVKQIAKIESQFANKDTLRVAFISDTHVWYSLLLPHESSSSVSTPTLQSMTI